MPSGQSFPGETRSPPSLEIAALPASVARIRARILEAAASGDISDLTVPLQWNEVPPLFIRSQPPDFDPIRYLKVRSFDRRGQEMLLVIAAVFRQPYVVRERGRVLSFDWPNFPMPLEAAPTPTQAIAPWRCVRFEDLTLRSTFGGPLIHRTSIGIDGTWQFFWPDI